MERRKAFLLRIDPALWAELEAWAQAELRSVNGQIEYVLRQAVARRKGASKANPGPTRAEGLASPPQPAAPGSTAAEDHGERREH